MNWTRGYGHHVYQNNITTAKLSVKIIKKKTAKGTFQVANSFLWTSLFVDGRIVSMMDFFSYLLKTDERAKAKKNDENNLNIM